MQQTLYLVRHTRPLIEAGICYGQLDVGLADSFAAEAAAVAASLPTPQLILSSPLQRSHRLAAYLAQIYDCELRCDERLKEMHFGDWEGRAWNDIERSELEAWSADILNFTPPHGESALQLTQRVSALLDELAHLPLQRIALVAHGGSMRAVLAHAAGIPLSTTLSWQIDFGSVVAVRRNPQRRV
ncbi:MAG TPA: alpha-ribazole phosphatase [Gallionellaceae bacterium]